jgi:hypothetical protein
MFGIRVSYVSLGLALILGISATDVEAGKERRHHSMRREQAHWEGYGHCGAAGHGFGANGYAGGHYASVQADCCGGRDWQHRASESQPSSDCQVMGGCCGVSSGTMMAAPTHNAVHPPQESVAPQNVTAPGT